MSEWRSITRPSMSRILTTNKDYDEEGDYVLPG